MAKLAKEITVQAGNQIGTLAKVTAPLKEAKVNIQAMCGWGEGNTGNILLLTDNNAQGIDALKKAGFAPQEKEVVVANIPNRVGTLAEMAQKLSERGVNIQRCYITAAGPEALVVLSTADNKKAVAALG